MPFPLRSLALLAGLCFLSVSPAADPTPPDVIKLDRKGKVKAQVPKEWKPEKPTNALRMYQFKIPSGEEGVADAELVVMEVNPNPEKSFPRWRTSFEVPEGTAMEDIGKVSKVDVPLGTAHILDVSGTWKYKEGPFSKTKEELRPGYRVMWVILVNKNEDATQFRFSGPAKVMAKHEKEFMELIKAFK